MHKKINDRPNIYQHILDHSQDEIFVTDKEGYTIYCNEVFEKNYNVKRSDILGTRFWESEGAELGGPSPIPNVIKDHQVHTAVHKMANGKKLVITATPVFTESGALDIIVENVRDITALEKIQTDLDKTRGTLEKYKNEVQAFRKQNLKEVSDIVSKSDLMQSRLTLMERVASVDSNILLLGASGTGKSMFAKFIHQKSERSGGPFISLNCATIPEDLLESELYGYTSGAFTGAKERGKSGLVELADGGTLFLDEIGELPLSQQKKLLELIQERHFKPLGSNTYKSVDIRVISATNQNLSALVENKAFREDLYYRIKVVELEIPPLSERQDDIKGLIELNLRKFDTRYRFSHKISDKALAALCTYSWPGNVRELQHLIEQLVVTLSDYVIDLEHLPPYIFKTNHINEKSSEKVTSHIEFDKVSSHKSEMETFEKQLLENFYNKFKSSYKVARALQMSQSTCIRKLTKYGLIDKTK